MSLVADYGSSSESENSVHSDSESSSSNSSTELAETIINTTAKLPAPDFAGDQIIPALDSTQNSVFANPFKDAENAKQAILEKHVKMVNSQDNVTAINGKRICWNFRKGKCRFGHNCIYAHDSDIQKSKEELELDIQLKQTVDYSYLKTGEFQSSGEAATKIQKRKKRPGLTQGIVPGKRVMKEYHAQQDKLLP